MANPTKSDSKKHNTPVTLEDVARAAGVTATTVSRALKGNDYVAAATREKILRIIGELNYTTNPAARALATGKTGIIAVISAQLHQTYHANIVHLLESHITTSGYQMRLLHSRSELKDLIDATRTTSAGGIIINGMHDLSEELEFLNSQLSQNCVFLDTFAHAQTDYVRIDLRQAVKHALGLMLAEGPRASLMLGFLKVPSSTQTMPPKTV
ncbi:LacI family transcriptional regulator [bacterium]|nr:MAG: LacI family transcriptional regulator [bacterium]